MRELGQGAIKRARRLRGALSPPELKLWLELKAQSEGRCPYRKQHPIGPYVLDFYCTAIRLCVEVDGADHTFDARIERDAARDGWLRARGIVVRRLFAGDVLRAPGEAAWTMLRWVEELKDSPPPSLRPDGLAPPPPRAGEV